MHYNDLYHLYLHKKQTVEQLSQEFGVSISTIQRILRKYQFEFLQTIENKRIIVLMDATYWGRNFGVIVLKDSRTKRPQGFAKWSDAEFHDNAPAACRQARLLLNLIREPKLAVPHYLSDEP